MEKKTANEGLCFYRVKTEWTKEDETGVLAKVKTEELVMATSYTEAEKVAYAIAENQQRTHYGSMNLEIIKTKINDVVFNDILVQESDTTCGLICNYFEEAEDSGVGLYMVKVILFTIDEKSGKTKRSSQTIFVPATSNSDATKRVDEAMRKTMADFVVRDTRFDKAEAIYWPKTIHQLKARDFDLE